MLFIPPEIFAFMVLSQATPMSIDTNGAEVLLPDPGILSFDSA
jgi:hypothetical protein